MSQPRLRVFAGPNGSGKSTVFNILKNKYNCGHYINPDELLVKLENSKQIKGAEYGISVSREDFTKYMISQSSLLNTAISKGYTMNIGIENNCINCPTPNVYEAALISGYIRDKMIENKINFTTETVLSHPSKIEQIEKGKANGYKTYLYFVCLDSPELNKARVKERFNKGGHDVPPELIESRYKKTLDLSYTVAQSVDKAYFIDNSDKPKLIAKMEKGILTVLDKNPPKWFKENVLKKSLNKETKQTIKAEVKPQQNIFKDTHKGLSL